MARLKPHVQSWSIVALSAALILQPIGAPGSRRLLAQGPTHGQGAVHRADPCQHLQGLPEQAQADDRQCLSLGHSNGVARGDFNGDGIADLAIGTPNEGVVASRAGAGGQPTPTNIVNAGTVTVIFGSATDGLSTGAAAPLPPQFIRQELDGVAGFLDTDDKFGSALASGDFNGDGFSDLAVSVPGDNAIQIFDGSASGLKLTQSHFITGDQFVDNQNNALTLLPVLSWGDFNGDGFGDLAIGATEPEGTGVRLNVIVMSGSQQFGVQFTGLRIFSFDNANVGGEFTFGNVAVTLAAGDFNGDGATDLAVGLPFADVLSNIGTNVIDGGTVTIMRGVAGPVPTGGITATGATGLTELNANFVPQELEHFGAVLAAGDFDGDGSDDLAIGTPDEDVVGTSGNFVQDGGFVAVFSHATTLHARYTQLPLGLNPQAGDRFGAALAAADFNNDGAEDLVIGTPGDTINGVAGAGSVTVIYGIVGVGLPRPASIGLPQINGTVQNFNQATAGLGETPESGDHFGATLTAWNFGRSTHKDLVIGVPDEGVLVLVRRTLFSSFENRSNAGALHVLYGSDSGLQATGSQLWTQNSAGVPDGVEAGDRFGSALY